MARKTTRKADVRVLGGEGSGLRRPGGLLLGLLLLVVAAPGCNLFNDLGNAWGTSGMTDPCAGLGTGGGGAGGGAGGGGGANLGGSDPGAGGSSVEGSGAGAGGSEMGARVAHANAHRPLRPRFRHRIRSRIGTAYQADCPGMTPDPALPMWGPKTPTVVPLTTMRLRSIAAAQGIGAGKTGIQFSREVGIAFETWVLTTRGQTPRNDESFLSLERQSSNSGKGGLPASVIPEFVAPLFLFGTDGSAPFPKSQLFEVKAVAGVITLGTSQFQIYGLIDVASKSAAGVSPIPKHPPPQVVFTTTGNSVIANSVLDKASQFGVAIWQDVVFEDGSPPDDPTLYLGSAVPLNREVYGTSTPVVSPSPWTPSKLTSPPTQLMPVPGDPDPPEVD